MPRFIPHYLYFAWPGKREREMIPSKDCIYQFNYTKGVTTVLVWTPDAYLALQGS